MIIKWKTHRAQLRCVTLPAGMMPTRRGSWPKSISGSCTSVWRSLATRIARALTTWVKLPSPPTLITLKERAHNAQFREHGKRKLKLTHQWIVDHTGWAPHWHGGHVESLQQKNGGWLHCRNASIEGEKRGTHKWHLSEFLPFGKVDGLYCCRWTLLSACHSLDWWIQAASLAFGSLIRKQSHIADEMSGGASHMHGSSITFSLDVIINGSSNGLTVRKIFARTLHDYFCWFIHVVFGGVRHNGNDFIKRDDSIFLDIIQDNGTGWFIVRGRGWWLLVGVHDLLQNVHLQHILESYVPAMHNIRGMTWWLGRLKHPSERKLSNRLIPKPLMNVEIFLS